MLKILLILLLFSFILFKAQSNSPPPPCQIGCAEQCVDVCYICDDSLGYRSVGGLCTLCPIGQFHLQNGSCQSCQKQNCSDCIKIQQGSVITEKCIICAEGYFNKSDNDSCVQCALAMPGCLRCSPMMQENISTIQCDECAQDYRQVSNACNICDQGYYDSALIDTGAPICTASSLPFCIESIGFKSKELCVACESGFQIQGGRCYCGSTSQVIVQGEAGLECVQCQDLIQNCEICQEYDQTGQLAQQNDITCQQCTYPNVYYNNQCTSEPPCLILNCEICNSYQNNLGFQQNCSYCSQNYYLKQDENNTFSCEACPSGCSFCGQSYFQINGVEQMEFKCFSCQDGYNMIWEIGVCTICDIQNGEFENSLNQCEKCNSSISNCQQCYYDKQLICSQCENSYQINYKINQCITCAEGEYQDDNGACSPCQNAINHCTNCQYQDWFQFELFCHTCEPGFDFNLIVKLCVNCTKGQYVDQQGNCLSCEISNCDYCEKPGYCQYCQQGYTFNQGECISCDQGDNCIDCHLEYQEQQNQIEGGENQGENNQGTNTTTTYEIVCNQYGCLNDNEFYYDGESNKCVPCHYSCNQCYGTKPTDCIWCNQYDEAGNNQYQNWATFECTPCSSSNQFYDANAIADPKNDNNWNDFHCINCDTILENCSTCGTNYTLKNGIYVLGADKNQLKCQECYWGYQLVEGACIKVDCSSINNCSICIDNLGNIQCQQCQSGYFVNNINGQCEFCQYPCNYCEQQIQDSVNQTAGVSQTEGDQQYKILCYSCEYPFEINYYNYQCSSCIYGTYENTDGICQECDLNCQSCYFDLQLSNPRCTQCVETFYVDWDIGVCRACPQNCLNCDFDYSTSDIQCYQCIDGFILDQSQSQANQTNGSCISCSKKISNCESCYFNWMQKLECQQCSKGFNYNNVQYICTKCKDYEYEVKASAKADPTCSSCSAKIIHCQNCGVISGYGTSSKVTCYQCEYGYYFNQITQLCELCSTAIKGCQFCNPISYGKDEEVQNVLACFQCDDGNFWDYQTGLCTPCQQRIPNCTLCNFSINQYGQDMQPEVYCYQCQNGLAPSWNSQFCTNCYQGQYDTNFGCKNCNDAIFGCSNCHFIQASDEEEEEILQCDQCDSGFYSNWTQDASGQNIATCGSCSQFVENCQQCSYQGYWEQKNQQNQWNEGVDCWQCAQGYFFQQNDKSCQLCEIKMQGCSDCSLSDQDGFQQFTCWNCYEGYFYNYYSQKCTTCPITQYLANDGSCAQCTDILQYECQSCHLDNEQSSPICDSCIYGYFINNINNCQLCSDTIANCLNCFVQFAPKDSQILQSQCYQCEEGWHTQPWTQNQYNNSTRILQKIQPKVEQKYFDTTSCQSCSDSIPNCSGCYAYFNENQQVKVECYACKAPYRLVNGICTICGENQYQIGTSCKECSSLISNCLQCHQNKINSKIINICDICSLGFSSNQDQTQCISCNDKIQKCGLCQLGEDQINYQCFWCIAGYYLNQNLQCSSCSSLITNCKECFNQQESQDVLGQTFIKSTVICTSCSNSKNLIKSQNTCKTCKEDQFQQGQTDQASNCQLCRTQTNLLGCYSCSDANTCLTCLTGFALNSNSRCDSCPERCDSCHYDQDNLVCDMCNYIYPMLNDGTCSICFQSEILLDEQCTKCSKIFENCEICQDSLCQTCQPGYYLDESNQCQICSNTFQNCQECDQNSCYQCKQEYLFDGFQCSLCKNYQYYVQEEDKCYTCKQENCNQCDSQGNCLYCNWGYVLNENLQCSSCDEKIQNCQGCQWDYSTFNYMCYYCYEGYYFNQLSGQCIVCSSVIEGCTGCYIQQNDKGFEEFNCYSCIQTQFFDPRTKTCNSCGNKFDIQFCNECHIDYIEQNFICDNCQDQYAFNSETKQCLPIPSTSTGCGDNCYSCQVSSAQSYKCRQCFDGYIINLSDGQCYSPKKCLMGFFQQGNQCVSCSNNTNGIKGCFSCGLEWNYVDNIEQLQCYWCLNDYEMKYQQIPVSTKDYSYSQSQLYCIENPGIKNCPKQCLDCEITPEIAYCSGCKEGFIVDPKSPYKECKLDCSNSDLNLEGCLQCHYENEDEFENPKCDLCKAGHILEDGFCQDIAEVAIDCPLGQVFHIYELDCVDCPENCGGCSLQWNFPQIDEETNKMINSYNITQVIQYWNYEIKKCQFCIDGFKLNGYGICEKSSYVIISNPCGNGCAQTEGNCYWDGILYYWACTNCSPNYIQIADEEGYSYCTLDCGEKDDENEYFEDLSNGCTSCKLNQNSTLQCSECDSDAGFFLNKQFNCVQQLSECDSGQFFDPNENICKSCIKNCIKCQYDDWKLASKCNYCSNGYKLSKEGSCQKKTDISASNCPSETYDDQENQVCIQCPGQFCKQCIYDDFYSYCTECYQGFEWDDIQQSCTEIYLKFADTMRTNDCSDGYYYQDGTCMECPVGCASCYFDQYAICYSCINTEDWYLTSQNSCVSTLCDEEQIFTTNWGCTWCPWKCDDCGLDSLGYVTCNACSEGYINNEWGYCDFNGICLDGQTLFYGYTCVDCPSYCSTCEQNQETYAIECLTCNNEANLDDTVQICVPSDASTCEVQQFWGYGGWDWSEQCHDCSLGCEKCIFDYWYYKEICLTCSEKFEPSTWDPYFCQIKLGEAVTCKQGTYLFQYQSISCEPCPCGCSSCHFDYWSWQTICETCSDGFSIGQGQNDPNKCYLDTPCDSGQYYSCEGIGACVNCPNGCSLCDINLYSTYPPYMCSECDADFELWNTTCVLNTCVDGQKPVKLADSWECQPCQNNCSYCQIDYWSTPPQEYCYQCQTGFYLENGECQEYPICGIYQNDNGQNVGTYLVLEYDSSSYLSYNFQCLDCPKGCALCTNTDVYNLWSAPSCYQCNDGYDFDEWDYCRSDAYFNKEDCTEGQYQYLNNDEEYVCGDCTKGCSQCGQSWSQQNQLDCYDCKQGYYYQYDNENYIGKCLKLPNCPGGQYCLITDYSANIFGCDNCPQQCESCILQNIYDPWSIQCTKCKSGYSLSDYGECLQMYDPTQAVNCPFSQFAYVYDGFLYCAPCPDSCKTCGFENLEDVNSYWSCSSCQTGYILEYDYCISSCSSGQYVSSSGECMPCYYSCQDCYGKSASECNSCKSGYAFNSNWECAVEVIKEKPTCSIDSYYDDQREQCVCLDSTLFYQENTSTCVDFATFNAGCGIGTFKKDINGQSICEQCADSLCSVCVGGGQTDCIQCHSGYYFDYLDYQCKSCQQNCAKCWSQQYCEICDSGYLMTYVYMNNNYNQICSAQCPSGYLPYVASLYYLNNIFSEQELLNAWDYSNEIQSTPVGTISAAVSIWGAPIFSADLPWQLVNGVPTYKGNSIQLECTPCGQYCSFCPSGMIKVQNDDHFDCWWGEYCPFIEGQTLIKQTNDQGDVQCVEGDSTEFHLLAIQIPSLDIEAPIQSTSKILFLEAITTKDDQDGIQYIWTLDNVSKDFEGAKLEGIYTDQDLTTSQVIEAKNRFFSNAIYYKNTVQIPSSNLEANVKYSISLSVEYQGNVETGQISFASRNLKKIKSLSSLGVSNSLISVTPLTGVSGENIFEASYNFGNIQAFQKGTSNTVQWLFSIQIGGETGIPITSEDLTHSEVFQIPVFFEGNDQIIDIRFVAQYGEFVYEAFRQVQVSANLNFDILNSDFNNKLANPSSLTPGELACGALNLSAQISNDSLGICPNLDTIQQANEGQKGDCQTLGSTSECCENGTCHKNPTSGLLLCNCKTQFGGQYCQLDAGKMADMQELTNSIVNALSEQEVTQSTAQTLTTSFTACLNSGTVDLQTSELIMDKMNEIADTVADTSSLSRVLETANLLASTTNSEQYANSSPQEIAEAQDNVRSIILNSVTSLADNLLGPGTSEITFNTGGISGTASFINPQTAGDTSNFASVSQTGEQTTSGINTIVFEDSENAIILQVMMPIAMSSFAQGADALKSGNVELQIHIDGQLKEVSNLEQQCGIKINFVVPSSLSSENSHTCLFLKKKTVDGVLTSYYDGEGCTLFSETAVEDGNEVVCCCSHLTMFSLGTGQSYQQNYPNNNGGGNKNDDRTEVTDSYNLRFVSLAVFLMFVLLNMQV